MRYMFSKYFDYLEHYNYIGQAWPANLSVI